MKYSYILTFQGAYYVFTALWAIAALDHFSRVTGLHAEGLDLTDRFEMYSIAALALVLGLFFIWGAAKENLQRPAGFLALGSAVAVIVPELIYLPQIGNPILFWLDFAEESVVALLLVYLLFKSGSGD